MMLERRSSMQPLPALIIACLLCLSAGCEGDDDGPTPIEPDCTLDGSFTVELGEDQDGFTSIPEGAEPTLIYGAQGGTHLVLAAHLLTPDPLDLYEVSLVAEVGEESCVDSDCVDFVTAGQFTDVRGELEGVSPGQGEAEVSSLFLIVNGWDSARVRRITLDVSDACGRAASDQRIFGPES